MTSTNVGWERGKCGGGNGDGDGEFLVVGKEMVGETVKHGERELGCNESERHDIHQPGMFPFPSRVCSGG